MRHKSLNNFFSNNKFLGSYLDYNKIPTFNKPEVCFIGRSNVGKSSLINRIAKNKKLAKTSKTPGRTQSINLFSISDRLIFADLPGYGFANIPETLKKKLYYLIRNYIEKRIFLKNVFLLIDGKVGIKESDQETITYFIQKNISFALILTKIDKCTKNLLNNNKKEIINLLNQNSSNYSNIFFTSSFKNKGISDIQKNIYNLTKE